MRSCQDKESDIPFGVFRGERAESLTKQKFSANSTHYYKWLKVYEKTVDIDYDPGTYRHAHKYNTNKVAIAHA